MTLLRRAGKVKMAAVVAWIALAVLALVRHDGIPVPYTALAVVAALALTISLVESGRSVVSMWRGPSILGFSGDEAEVCTAREAEDIRAAARLRGMLGGAGHVHSARLLLPAVGWLAAGVVAASALLRPELESVPAWPAMVAAVGLGSAMLFPAQPFFYREAMNGRVIVSPRNARTLIVGARWNEPSAGGSGHPGGRGPGARADGDAGAHRGG